MQIPERLEIAAWLAIVVLVIAGVSEGFGLSHDPTFVAIVVSGILLAVHWLTSKKR